VSTSKDIYI